MPAVPLDQVLVMLLILVVVGLWWLVDGEGLGVWWGGRQQAGQKKGGQRTLRARSPKDCACCQAGGERAGQGTRQGVEAWGGRKGRAGRPKSYASEGLACPRESCAYYGITDGAQHALVRDGWRGKRRDIAYWRCQACGARFSGRRHSALYQLKTAPARVGEVLTALAEGVDVAAASRIFGHHPTTLRRWLQRGAAHGQRLHERLFRHLRVAHVQVDELVTRVRAQVERVWVWTAIDVQTKLLLAVHIGRRTQQDAHTLIHRLKERLAADCLPVFTSDGLNQYFYALTAHFGQWVTQKDQRAPVWQVASQLLYGQLRKVRVGYKLKYTYTRVLLGTRDGLKQALQALALSGKITTAFVERLNLTLRELVAPLARRTWSLAHDESTLAAYVAWGRTYYHFARYHQTLQRQTSTGRTRSRTPAMAAGLVPRRYTVQELLAWSLPG